MKIQPSPKGAPYYATAYIQHFGDPGRETVAVCANRFDVPDDKPVKVDFHRHATITGAIDCWAHGRRPKGQHVHAFLCYFRGALFVIGERLWLEARDLNEVPATYRRLVDLERRLNPDPINRAA